jgi:hypothetical protein
VFEELVTSNGSITAALTAALLVACGGHTSKDGVPSHVGDTERGPDAGTPESSAGGQASDTGVTDDASDNTAGADEGGGGSSGLTEQVGGAAGASVTPGNNVEGWPECVGWTPPSDAVPNPPECPDPTDLPSLRDECAYDAMHCAYRGEEETSVWASEYWCSIGYWQVRRVSRSTHPCLATVLEQGSPCEEGETCPHDSCTYFELGRAFNESSGEYEYWTESGTFYMNYECIEGVWELTGGGDSAQSALFDPDEPNP